MRILLCLLAMVATPTWAEWVEMGESANLTHYIDPATFKKNGHLRRVWEMQDLKQRHKDGEISRRYMTEYDCKEERLRILSTSAHSEPMAGGKPLDYSNSVGTWVFVPPDTPSADVLKLVCAK